MQGSNPLVPTDHGIETPPDKKGEKSGGVPNVWKDCFRTIYNRSRIIIAYYFCEKWNVWYVKNIKKVKEDVA